VALQHTSAPPTFVGSPTMGQKIGKVELQKSAALPFANLSRLELESLFSEFRGSLEGYALSKEQVNLLLLSGRRFRGAAEEGEARASALFQTLDTDENGKIDGLELLSTLVMLSAEGVQTKLGLLFQLFDLGGGRNAPSPSSASRSLTQDELTLLLSCTSCGMSKLANETPPSLEECETITQRACSGRGISLGCFIDFCLSSAIVESWIASFEDIDCRREATEGTKQFCYPYPHFGKLADELAPVSSAEPVEALPWMQIAEELCAKPVPAEGEDEADADAPEDVPPSSTPAPGPNASLHPKWIYGFTGPAQYAAADAVVYAAGTVGVSLLRRPAGEENEAEEEESSPQRYCLHHEGSISALAISPCGLLAATGDTGASPKIVIWNTTNGIAKMVFTGIHTHGIAALTWNRDGSMLASVGADDRHRLVVYGANAPYSRNLSALTGPQVPKGLAFLPGSGCSLVTCGDDGMSFWMPSVTQDILEYRSAAGPAIGAQRCVSSWLGEEELVSADTTGSLLLWRGRCCVRVIERAHDGAIESLSVRPFGEGSTAFCLATGGLDCKVRLWSAKLEVLAVLDMLAVSSARQAVQSVCLSGDGRRALVQTAGAEVYELSTEAEASTSDHDQEEGAPGKKAIGYDLNGGALISGHAPGSLRALTMAPSGSSFTSGGDDRTLRVWSLADKKQVAATCLDGVVVCTDWASEGAFVAVGTNDGPRGSEVIIFEVLEDSLLQQGEVSFDSRISCIRFSPKSSGRIAVGLDDGTMCIIEKQEAPAAEAEGLVPADADTAAENVEGAQLEAARDLWVKGNLCPAGTGPVCAMDYSTQATWIMVNTSGGDLSVHSGETGMRSSPADVVASSDRDWVLSSCTMSPQMQDVWQACHPTLLAAVAEGPVLMVSDVKGYLHAFNRPTNQGSPGATFWSRSTSLKGLAMTGANSPLSAGAEGCIIEWALTLDEDAESAEVYVSDSSEEIEAAEEEESKEGNEMMAPVPEIATAIIDEDILDPPAGGGAVSRMHMTVNQTPAAALGVPGDDLVLDWLHGYASQSTRESLHYNAEGSLLYPAATMGVLLSTDADGIKYQSYLREHSQKVTSIAMHPNRQLAASAEAGNVVALWQMTGANRYDASGRIILPGNCPGVSQIAFSPCGGMLAVAAADAARTLYIYHMGMSPPLLCCSAGTKSDGRILALSFDTSSSSVLVAGHHFFSVWEIHGSQLQGRTGIFGSQSKVQRISAAIHVDGASGSFIMAGEDGTLITVTGHRVTAVSAAHEGGVSAFCTLPPEGPEGATRLLTGGASDGMVKIWSMDDLSAAVHEIDLSARLSRSSASIRALSAHVHGEKRKIAVGTSTSEIWEISATDGSEVQSAGPLVCGHFMGELLGLASHPKKPMFSTVAGDGLVREWGAGVQGAGSGLRRQIKLSSISPAQALCYSPQGVMLAVGLQDGTIELVSGIEDEFRTVKVLHDATACIRAISFSPDGNDLAATAGGKVYVYDVVDGFTLKVAAEMSKESLVHMDFASDGSMIRVQSTDGVITCCSPASGDPTAVDVGQTSWATDTCPADPLRDLYTDRDQQTTTNLFVAADGAGTVQLFLAHGARKSFPGHSGPTGGVHFLKGGNTVISVGSQDRCVLQWHRTRQGSGHMPVPPPAETTPEVGYETENIPRYEDHIPLQQPSFAYGCNLSAGIGIVAGGRIARAAGATVSLYNRRTNDQSFCGTAESSAAITSISASPCGHFLATGDQEGNICVWDAITLDPATSHPLARAAQSGPVKLLAFSQDGFRLACVVSDQDHTLSIWSAGGSNYKAASCLAVGAGIRASVLCICWDGPHVITAGVNHASFWSLAPNLSFMQGDFKDANVQTLTCAVGLKKGGVVTGTSSGELLLWTGTQCTSFIKAHEGPVKALTPRGLGFISGGVDSSIKLWDAALGAISEVVISTAEIVAITSGGVGFASSIVAMTSDSSVYEIQLDALEAYCILQGMGHGGSVLIATHPLLPSTFVTAGPDRLLRTWNSVTHRAHCASTELPRPAAGIKFSEDGSQIRVALQDSDQVATFDSKTMNALDGSEAVADAHTSSPEPSSLEAYARLHGHLPEDLTSACVACNGKSAFTSSRDGLVLQWTTS
jgi:WD40 repeat protein